MARWRPAGIFHHGKFFEILFGLCVALVAESGLTIFGQIARSANGLKKFIKNVRHPLLHSDFLTRVIDWNVPS